MIEFKAWPKTPRLNRDCIITEKIDGTNAAVIILPFTDLPDDLDGDNVTADGVGVLVETDLGEFIVAAQSRKRIISPGKQSDNAGFAQWVRTHAQGLAEVLGDGYHYGEWWGSKIARTYGKVNGEKQFSLFNVLCYADVDFEAVPGLGLVPILYDGPFSTDIVDSAIKVIRNTGSLAAPGQKAEGVIIFHKAAGHVYKVLCENDELPKGVAEISEV